MKGHIRRVFAVLLAVVLAVGILPYSASADANRHTDTSYQEADAIVGEEIDVPSADSSDNSQQVDSANRLLSTGNNANPTSPEDASTASSPTDGGVTPQNEGEDLAELSVYAQVGSVGDTAAKAAKTAQARANNNAGDFNVTGDSGWNYYQGVWIDGSGFYDRIQITKSGTYTITGDGSEHEGYYIKINGGINVNLMLKDVKIRCSASSTAAMDIEGKATVTLNLEGDNSFTSTGDQRAGVEFCAQTGSLTI